MTFTIIDAEQRSQEWFKARVGRLTGSCASDMLATIQKGEAAKRRDLRVRLVVERLTGEPQEDGFINAVMQRGIDLEPAAFDAYERERGLLVRRTGFLAHTEHMVGCSLDGDVDNFTGTVELKCPKSATHFGYLKTQGIPAEHRPQLLHNLWVTGAQWVDFVSYDDRFPEAQRLFVARLTRTPELQIEINAYEKCALAFLAEVERDYQQALTLGAVAEVA